MDLLLHLMHPLFKSPGTSRQVLRVRIELLLQSPGIMSLQELVQLKELLILWLLLQGLETLSAGQSVDALSHGLKGFKLTQWQVIAENFILSAQSPIRPSLHFTINCTSSFIKKVQGGLVKCGLVGVLGFGQKLSQ